MNSISSPSEQDYYRISSPVTVVPDHNIEWFITLSKYSFPWIEVAFDGFSAKECYEVFRE
jgi:hypothetical protein